MTFKKGAVTNPKGRPVVPDEIKFARKLNKQFVEVKITEMLRKSVKEIEEILKNKDNESIEHFLGRIILMGIVKGDPVRLNFLFERVIGRVKDVKDIQINKPFRVESLAGDRTIELGMTNHEEI